MDFYLFNQIVKKKSYRIVINTSWTLQQYEG